MSDRFNNSSIHPFSRLTPEVILEAADYFGSRSTGRILQLNAMENRVFEVELEDDSFIVLKFYRPNRWTEEQILEEHEWLKLAHEEELPVVPPLVSTKTRKTLNQATDGFLYAAFPKKLGRLEPELNREQLKSLGKHLARLHLIGAKINIKHRLILDPHRIVHEALDHLRNSTIKPETLWDRFETISLNILKNSLDRFNLFPKILTHGDCHVGNVLWRNNELLFVDFDDMIIAPAVQDFWMLTGGDDEEALKHREILMESYSLLKDIPNNSLSLIPILRAVRIISFLHWIDKRWLDPSFPKIFTDYPTQRYWMDQLETLYQLGESI